MLSIAFAMLTVVSYTQSPIYACRKAFDPDGTGISRKQYDDDYLEIYPQYSSYHINVYKPSGIEVKSKNKQYRKVYLHPDYILERELIPDIKGTDTRSSNSSKYMYLYKAYVELAPDAHGNKKEQVLLFFSNYNIRSKRRWQNDTKTAYEKEIVADIDNNPIVAAETQPEIFLEVNEYYDGSSTPKMKVFGTTTFIYDINSLHPNKTPFVIGRFFQYKQYLESSKNYETATLINYSQNGKISGNIEYILKEGGATLPQQRVEKIDENGKILEVNFNQNFGMNMVSGEVFLKVGLSIPTGVQKQWSAKIRDFNTQPDLLAELSLQLGREPVENKEQLREFLINFQKLNEYIILDETNKTVFGVPKKYIYKGTYNKKGVPDGWGIMYVANDDDEYYLGQFKDGMPDGLGIRYDFKLDRPDIRYSSTGMHVGNTLVYGSRTTGTANNYGYYVAYGDFRQGELNGKGSRIWYLGNNGVGDLYYGNFQDGKRHGMGSHFDNNKMLTGVFENGSWVSGNNVTDKIYDNNFYPGAVVLYKGKKYVIMKKENGMFLFDNGISVSTKADVSLTGERSLRSKNCLICNGSGYLKPTTNTVFSGVTKTKKTYETGPSGYIVWEKTTTSTTAPVTTYRTNRCTACTGGLSGSEPVPLKPEQR